MLGFDNHPYHNKLYFDENKSLEIIRIDMNILDQILIIAYTNIIYTNESKSIGNVAMFESKYNSTDEIPIF